MYRVDAALLPVEAKIHHANPVDGERKDGLRFGECWGSFRMRSTWLLFSNAKPHLRGLATSYVPLAADQSHFVPGRGLTPLVLGVCAAESRLLVITSR